METTAQYPVNRLSARPKAVIVVIQPAQWNDEDITTIQQALVAAPSILNTQPWNLVFTADGAQLYEQTTHPVNTRSSLNADRLMSCGAAITNLEVAARALGFDTHLETHPDPHSPHLLAVLKTGDRQTPSSTVLAEFSAMLRRHSYRGAFRDRRVSDIDLADIVAAGTTTDSQGPLSPRVLANDEAAALAETLADSAAEIHLHDSLQQDQFAWSAQWRPEGIGEIAEYTPGSLPGQVHISTATADTSRLADLIEQETVLIFLGHSEEKETWVEIGRAMQRAWLSAVDAGLAASVLSQPLCVGNARSVLSQRLHLNAIPFLIMRFGYPLPDPALR
ncbi:MAG: nitroreductase family protein [Mycobacteriaceae bacterium]